MSGRARLGLIALAVAIAVGAFVVIGTGSEDEKADDPANQATETEAATESTGPTATAESAPPPPPDEVVLRDGRPVGGVERIAVEKGDTVRLIVTSDASDEIHLHGYDITRTAAPGKPARFRFEANTEGVFEIESHTAEDAGRDPLIARLVVEPA